MNMEIRDTSPVFNQVPDQFLWYQCIAMTAAVVCDSFSAAGCIGLCFIFVLTDELRDFPLALF